MTQEQKDLLIKDLCARLPYGVKFNFKYGEYSSEIMRAIYLQDYVIISSKENSCEINDIKPYLFPISSMTEEQENEWNDLHLNPLGEILEDKFIGREKRLQLMFKSMSDPIQWCYKNHFDCNGLIPLGLAIDATNLNIY